MIVDLSELHFADPSLMIDLACLAQRLRAQGRTLWLSGAQPNVRTLIETVGLHRLPAVRSTARSPPSARSRREPLERLAAAPSPRRGGRTRGSPRRAAGLAGTWAECSRTRVPAPSGSSSIVKSVEAAKRGAGLPFSRSASWHHASARGGSQRVIRWSTSERRLPQ